MNTLSAAGLSDNEAKAYEALLERPAWKPSELARHIGESRTNCYKLLDNLVGLHLAEKMSTTKTLRYRALHPARLNELAQARRLEQEQLASSLNTSLPHLTSQFTKISELPGIKVFSGKENIKTIFEDMLAVNKDIHLIRSAHDVAFYGDAFFTDFKKKRAAHSITTHALTPLLRDGIEHSVDDDAFGIVRTWLPRGSYDSSVEWDIYGDKVAILIYTDEEIALLIESKALADSLRQLIELLGAKGR